MDEFRFDTLTKSLTAAGSRRQALGGLLVASLALLGGAPIEEAAAKSRKPCKKLDNKRKRQQCLRKARQATATTTPLPGNGTPSGQDTPLPPECAHTTQCTGGQVCVDGRCQDCTSYTQCAGHACLAGRCRGFNACGDNDACKELVPSGSQDLICNEGGSVNSEAPADVCIFNPITYEGKCDAQNACTVSGTVCVLGSCLVDCRQGGVADCDTFYIPGTHPCVGGLCLSQ